MNAAAIGPVIGFIGALVTIQAAGVAASFAMSARARPARAPHARWVVPAVGALTVAVGLFATADAISAAVGNSTTVPGNATSTIASLLMQAWIVALLGTWALVGINWCVVRATKNSRPRVVTAEETLAPYLEGHRAHQEQVKRQGTPADGD